MVHTIRHICDAYDKTWVRAQPSGTFEAYNQNLIILLDIIENIELTKLPPAILESIAHNLDSVSYYIVDNIGKVKQRIIHGRTEKIIFQ